MEHYSLELTLVPELRAMEGIARIRALSRVGGNRELVLDLAALQVSSVSAGVAASLPWTHAGDQLKIALEDDYDPEWDRSPRGRLFGALLLTAIVALYVVTFAWIPCESIISNSTLRMRWRRHHS